MRRLTRGWRYARQSLAIVRQDGALTALAAIGLALGLGLAAGPLVVAVWAFDAEKDVVGWVASAATCLAFYVGLTYSGVAIASAAAEVIGGRDAHVTASLGVAARRLRPILGWCVFGTLVALVLAVVRKKGGRAGSLVADVGGETWSLVTFLAVPIIAFEGLDPVSTLKRSASLFRQKWGEQMGGTVSISLVFGLFSLPALAAVFAGIALVVEGSRPAGFAVAIVGLLALAAVAVAGRAASATFGAILYGYATNGEVPATIPRAELENVALPASAAP